MTLISQPRLRWVITDAEAVSRTANQLGTGGIVGHAFANFYVITARADAGTVQRVNRMKGRPADQVGSLTGPPMALPYAWDLDRLPTGLDRRRVLNLIDTLFTLGPFGFRGPSPAAVPSCFTTLDGDLRTTQVIAPGYACPSNRLLSQALTATGGDFLSITSANRSRQLTGAAESPSHWRCDGLRAEFGGEPDFILLEHDDEQTARARYPQHLPMSTTVLALHRVVSLPGDSRPHLVLERQGSLPANLVRAVLADFGFGMLLGPHAQRRLGLRDYRRGLSDRERIPPLIA